MAYIASRTHAKHRSKLCHPFSNSSSKKAIYGFKLCVWLPEKSAEILCV